MFGKKSKDSSAAAPRPEGGKAKASKPQRRITAKSGPNFFAAHVEKIALASLLGLAGYLIYGSLAVETLPSTRTPDSLNRQAQDLMTKVNQESHWENILPEREQFVRHQFHQNAKAARKPAQPNLYAFGKLEPPTVREVLGKRIDPEIFPVEQVHVRNVFGTLATAERVSDRNAKDPFADFEDAEPLGRRTPPRDRPRPGARGGDVDASGQLPASTTQVRRLQASYDLGAQFGGMAASAMGDSSTGLGGLSLPAGRRPGGAAAGDPNRLSDTTGPTYRLGSRPVLFNVITALIPHRRNAEEFDRAFASTGTFVPERDMPAYLNVEIQRADVTGAPNREIKEDEWKTIATIKDIHNLPIEQRWATHFPPDARIGSPLPEVIDPQAIVPALTAPLIPLLVRDYREFSRHPRIDWQWNARSPMGTRIQQPRRPAGTLDDDALIAGAGGAGRVGGLSGDSSGVGFGLGDSAGGGRMFGGTMGLSDDGGSGSSGMSFGGGSTGLAAGFQSGPPELQPEFKMLRAYDMLEGKDRGRSFRYRVRLMMRDPNYPEDLNRLPAPMPEELENSVFERVHQLRRDEDKLVEEALRQNRPKMRTQRYTEWSQPSPPVFVTQPTEVFAGDVDAKGARLVAAQLVGNPPGVVMAAEIESAQRGHVLGAPVAKRDFIVPTTKVVKQINQAVVPGAVLVDMRGGVPLAGDRRDDPLSTIGEVMVLRLDGSLIFSNSLDDQLLYRMYSFQEDKEAARANPD